MLRFIESEHGLIPEVKQRRLASLRDPITEARSWLAKQNLKSDFIFVMGIGAGFHVLELMKQYPEKKILCFEALKELREHYQNSFQLRSLEDASLIEACKESGFQHEILVHPSSYRLFQEEYDRAIDFLNGRSIKSFELLLSYRGLEIRNREKLIDIKQWSDQELMPLIRATSPSIFEKMLILEEMLK